MMSGMRAVVRWLWASALVYTGATTFLKKRLHRRGAVIVLAFHRVVDDDAFEQCNSLPGIVMRRRTFAAIAAYAAGRFSMADLSRVSDRPASKGIRLAFTFDDGWRDNYVNAAPLARRFAIPITIFICPGIMGRSAPFWPEQVISLARRARPGISTTTIEEIVDEMKLWPPDRRTATVATMGSACRPIENAQTDQILSWTEVAELDRAGVNFGSHTHTHEILTAVREETARIELTESKSDLERRMEKPCDLFAYPNGNHSPATRRLLEEAGFALAFTIRNAPWTSTSDHLAVPRVNLSEDAVTGPGGRFSPALFEYMLFWKTAQPFWHANRC
jgi:peptidoglycan/xylan/chitin deacetylase (PgdA/CDA1 family)